MDAPSPASSPLSAPRRLRLVTAAALFDGHDAAINLMRRLLQGSGAEVIHLGHNRSVREIVAAALQEDVQGLAITSYQGGHLEFFRYLVDCLRAEGGGHIRVFGGGGGVIVPAEIAALEAYGVTRLYSPADGARLGLQGMIDEVLAACAPPPPWEMNVADSLAGLARGDRRHLARLISALEDGCAPDLAAALPAAAASMRVPVLGITGTGGAGKSSLTDELVRRLRLDQDDAKRIAILSVDPTRRRSGGALLGDRIRMNAIDHPGIFMRSLATREAHSELSPALPAVIAACRLAGFDLVLVETAGIGQGDAAIAALADVSLYVMTPEFGAASQLEKIDMLDYADFVAINKSDRPGAADALRDVRRQVQRNRGRFSDAPEAMPVFATQAARFNDVGVSALYGALRPRLVAVGLALQPGRLPEAPAATPVDGGRIAAGRSRYLAEVAQTVRDYHLRAAAQAGLAHDRQALVRSAELLSEAGRPEAAALESLVAEREAALEPESRRLLAGWPALAAAYAGEGGDGALPATLRRPTLAGTPLPRVCLPRVTDAGDLLRFLLRENLPGHFPFTAGVFPFKREDEEPTRMFAGEGDPFRTNRRFHVLSAGMAAKRLSTAFDSVTLYGCDPDERPDIYGKIGNAGVSVATLDDMKALYAGFDLCDPVTSVSMTINGPAPILLAMYFNTAIDQQRARFQAEQGRPPGEEEDAEICRRTLAAVRGTVQADILKEDQGQNTCIFSTEFSLKLMGDMQEFFVAHRVRNFYSVSISGYHIAEAGANPVTQLAFTLANAFTYVESYLARGMAIDDFAPNLSFFFSNGMDAEYAVIGRVARRIWAIAMKYRYGAGERSQKLKYHIQTSGRSLHAQEIAFNDIRTTLQALIALYDHCNSLHTNAYDEAITTPTDESVRRALAIQLIINREWGLARCENPQQGAYVIEELTDLVEAAVLREFDALAARGGVLGAMESGYQRGRIQDESLLYERRKHDGSLPIVGVNTFLSPAPEAAPAVALARSSEEEKRSQIERLRDFQARHREEAPARLAALKAAALAGGNVFAALMESVRSCSLGQITEALYEVGGQYRRSL